MNFSYFLKDIKEMKRNQKTKIEIIKLAGISLVAALLLSLPITHVLASDITSENLLNMINNERESRKIPKLYLNNDLNNAARLKSKDMINRHYFEHYAFGLTPWNFISNAGYEYLFAGENLAMDFQTSEGMVKAWMNSPAHLDNILNPEFHDIGIGIIKGEYTQKEADQSTIMVTNMFGREKPKILQVFDNFRENFLNFIF